METMSTNLYKVAASGDVAALEEMQNQIVDILAQVSHGGNTVLHISAFNGRVEFMERLLQLINEKSDEEATNEKPRHTFLKAQNKDENSALHEAVRGGDHAQIVQKLITADATLASIRNSKGESALFTAAANGRLNSLKLLLQIPDPLYVRSDGQTCLHHAVFYQKYGVAAELIKEAPELCKRADYILGNTPLHIAAFRGCRKNIVNKLLQCDPSSSFKQDKMKQRTPLHVAAQNGHAHVVRCILNFAEDCIEIRDEKGKTALHYAVENAQVEVVTDLALFEKGKLINIADNNGYTAFDIADQKYNEESLSPYFAIRWFLRSKNAIAGVEAANQRRETSKPFPSEERYSTTINSLSVCAILIATVTFQAAFTLPPSDKGNMAPSTQFSRGAFRSFVLFDWLAFCFSIVAAILLAYANFFRRHQSWIVSVSAIILPMALYMTMVSFNLAIFLQLWHDYYELASFFSYAMIILAPTMLVLISLVVLNALGIRILIHIIRALPFLIMSSGVLTFSSDE